MNNGLSNLELQNLISVFDSFPKINKVVLYGSRTKGNYKMFSDVDITIFGDNLTNQDLTDIIFAIDDLLLPYNFDISLFKTLKNKDLIDHIERKGELLYSK